MNINFYTAVVTLFWPDGTLDLDENKAVYQQLIDSGSDGIVLLGSTGEFCNLTLETAKELIDLALNYIQGRMRVIVGTCRMIPEESISLSNYALSKGADAVMLISPYYFPLSPANAEHYYDLIIPHVDGSVYLYNFPGCTGYELTPEMVLSLRRRHPNILGIKDTVKNFDHTRRLCQSLLPEFPDFEIYSGFDEYFIHNLLSGGGGCVGGLSNIYPELFARWKKAYLDKDWTRTSDIQKTVNRMMEMFEICTPFLTGVKHAMKLRCMIKEECSTAPFQIPSEHEQAQIRQLMLDIGL